MSFEYIYSIAEGNYFVSSQDNYVLWYVPIKGIFTVLGLPLKDYNYNALSFNINLKPTLQYGNIKIIIANKTYYLTYDDTNQDSNLILSTVLKDDKNQNFCFSTDGRILLTMYNPVIAIKNINNKLVGDTNLLKSLWKFSPFSPSKPDAISMWTPNLYGRPLSDLDQYFNNTSESSCNCSVSSECNLSYQTQLDSESCDAGFARKSFCLKTKWPDNNKSKCCMGDTTMLEYKDGHYTGKIDFGKCKLLHSTNICGRQFSDNNINVAGQNQNVKVGSWTPFSKDCSSNPDTINFCAQQDTLMNSPMVLTNGNCRNWCQDNVEECKISKQRYCEQYPFNPSCLDWCDKKEVKSDSCKQIVDNFCQGPNLEQDVCYRFCSDVKNNCDKKLLDYCKSIGDKAENINICGCFRGGQFYENYFKSLKSKGASSAVIPELPECLYAKCASAPIKTNDYYKKIQSGSKICPDIQQCISEVHIDNQGTIIGDIKIISNNDCKFNLRPQDCKNNQYIDTKTNSCNNCPDTSMPDSEKKTCLCLNNQILKDGKCVCPDTFIMSEDKKYCVCPASFELSPDKKSCICPKGQVIKDGICVIPKPEDFTPQLIDYIKKDLPINNEIDKNKVIVNAPEMASKVMNNGCNETLEIAKECSNFIPYICSLDGSYKYCKDNKDDSEFCNPDGTAKDVKSVYQFSCDKILKPRKPICKDDEYYDELTNECKRCPSDMQLKPDKSGCEPKKCNEHQYLDINNNCQECPIGMIVSPDGKGCEQIKCGNNSYLDLQTFTCVDCKEKVADPINHRCVEEPTLERQIREYIKTIDKYKKINIQDLNTYNEEISQKIYQTEECKINFNSAKKCVDKLLDTCENDPQQKLYGFECSKINKNISPDKDKKILFIILGIIGFFLLTTLIFKKKK